MRIVFVVNFPRSMNGEQDGRFSYLMERFAERGHEVELVTTDFSHSAKKRRAEPRRDLYKTKITLCHEPGYKKNVGIDRLYSHYVWGKNVGRYIRSLQKTPDVVYCAVPSLTANMEVAKYCQMYPNSKYIIDIQDVWPDAFTLVLPKYLKWILAPMKWRVDSFYRKADEVIAVSDTYRDRGLAPLSKKTRKGLTVYLGNNGKLFDEARVKYAIKRTDDEIWLAYIGTLGYSYDIPCVFEALSIYQKKCAEGKVLRFIVMGDGPFREEWEHEAKRYGVLCEFTGSLPYQEMVGRMCSCDIVVNPIRKGAAQSITNKVGDYALSGLPVINTQENPEYRHLVDEYRCGVNCECGNAEQVAEAIKTLVVDTDLRMKMGQNSRRLGEERFDRRVTYNNIIELVEFIGRKHV